jgi:hypothetical protein
VEGRWLRPAAVDGPARPIWGHAEGLRVGLYPLRGPRGLLRIYAPYLDHPEGRVINFIAVEPIRQGQPNRGLSELEPSALDGEAGKRFQAVDDPADVKSPLASRVARGEIVNEDGVEALHVTVEVERFDNGAHVYVRLTFRADRPHEVGLAAFAHADSAPLSHCILTATMGNYARLRRLHLADRTVSSLEQWPDYRGHAFTPHARFPLSSLKRTPAGHALVSATPDEPKPQDATYAPGTRNHWKYAGKLATQTWRCESPREGLEVWVNGRYAYWNSRAPIPGGVSFENFEMVSPFRNGDEFWFGVEPGVDSPKDGDEAGQQPTR